MPYPIRHAYVFAIKPFLAVAICVVSVSACTRTVARDPCGDFFHALKALPNESLIHSIGEDESLWDGAKHAGCEVRLVTNNNLIDNDRPLPNFNAQPDSELYRQGWRANNSYTADGPGSSVYGIEKGDTLCIVRENQPAHLEEHGKIVQSETLMITVQCRKM